MGTDAMRRTDIRIDKLTGHMDLMQLYAVTGEYNGRSLRVQITNGGVIEDQTGVDLYFGFKSLADRSEGVVAMTVVDITLGIYEVYYPSEMLQTAGLVLCAISIVDSESIAKTVNFDVNVEPSVIYDGMEVPENSIRAFDKLIMDVNRHTGEIVVVEATLSELIANYNEIITTLATNEQMQHIISTVDSISLDTSRVTEIRDMVSTFPDRFFGYKLNRLISYTAFNSDPNTILDVNGPGSLVGVFSKSEGADNTGHSVRIEIEIDDVVFLDLTLTRGSIYVSNFSMAPFYGHEDILAIRNINSSNKFITPSSTPQSVSLASGTSVATAYCMLRNPIKFNSSLLIKTSGNNVKSPNLVIFYGVE